MTDAANFTLRNEACATTVPATLSYDSANKKAILDPSEPQGMLLVPTGLP